MLATMKSPARLVEAISEPAQRQRLDVPGGFAPSESMKIHVPQVPVGGFGRHVGAERLPATVCG